MLGESVALANTVLDINLFGACVVRSVSGDYELNGAKHKALFALLATAPYGRRTRAFLQNTLWGTACYDSGRQSLRRALSDIRAAMGDDFSKLISTTNSDLTLDLSKVNFIGRPGAGEFLEGLELREEGFTRWLSGIRNNPGQVDSLYSLSRQAPARPVLPVVAVIPFRTMTGASESAVLGDWLAEEVTRSLSRSNLLAVISHLSSRRVASSLIDMGTVREQLGADFCVCGSVRSNGDEIVLDADFVDTRGGQILWTRRFIGRQADFLAHEAPGVDNIVRSVGASIADNAIEYTRGRPLAAIEDHRLLAAGVGLMHRPTLKEFARSRELLREALKRAPRAAEAHAWLGKWYVLSVFNGWTTDPARDTQLAIDCTAKALDIDPNSAFSLTIDGFAQNNLLQRLDIAASRYSDALHCNPNESLSWLLKGALHAFRDEADKALGATQEAIKISPIDPFSYFYDSLHASSHLAAGNFQEALELSDRSLSQNSRHLSTIRAKITALHNLDRGDEARKTAQELLRRQPDCTVAAYLEGHPAGNFKLGRRVADALAASGIPTGE